MKKWWTACNERRYTDKGFLSGRRLRVCRAGVLTLARQSEGPSAAQSHQKATQEKLIGCQDKPCQTLLISRLVGLGEAGKLVTTGATATREWMDAALTYDEEAQAAWR